LQLFELIAKAASFDGSARCVGFGKEEQHNWFSAKVFQTDRLTVLIRHSDLGSFIANVHASFFL